MKGLCLWAESCWEGNNVGLFSPNRAFQCQLPELLPRIVGVIAVSEWKALEKQQLQLSHLHPGKDSKLRFRLIHNCWMIVDVPSACAGVSTVLQLISAPTEPMGMLAMSPCSLPAPNTRPARRGHTAHGEAHLAVGCYNKLTVSVFIECFIHYVLEMYRKWSKN